jgi:hypothetical protein
MAIADKVPGFLRGKKERQRRSRETELEAKDWQERIQRAKKVRENWYEKFRVATCYEYRDGIQRPDYFKESEWITINLVYASLEAILPSLYSVDPYFYMSLKRSFHPHPMMIALYEQRGRVRQSMLNYYKTELKLKRKSRMAILDSFFQYGVIKVHTTGDLAENPLAGEQIRDGDGAVTDDNGEPLVHPDFLPANMAYQLNRIHPSDFLVDEDAGPLEEDVSWKAQRIVRPLRDVENDRRYAAKGRRKLKATEVSQDLRDREERKKGTSRAVAGRDEMKAELVVLWEIYDLRNRQWLTIAEGLEDEFLRKPGDLPPGVETDPFVDLRLTLRDDSWYPLPPVSQWLDAQREYDEGRSMMLRHRKNVATRKYAALDQAFSDPDEELAKLEYAYDGMVLRYQNPVGYVPVTPIQDAPLDQAVHAEAAYLHKDFDDLAVGSNQRGATRGVESATEAGILEARTRMREGDRLGAVTDFLIDISKKLDQQIQANITEDQAVRVTGPQGDFWELIRTGDYEEISGEFEYRIDVGSTQLALPEVERAQWTAFLGLLAGAPQLLLSKRLLMKQAELHHIEDEAMIEELHQIGKQMMSGQLPMPGAQGSQPGAPDPATRPASLQGGLGG